VKFGKDITISHSFKADFLRCILSERESSNHAVRLSLKTVIRAASQPYTQSCSPSLSQTMIPSFRQSAS